MVISGVQLTNPFYSIWATKSGRNLGVSFDLAAHTLTDRQTDRQTV